MGKLCFQRKTIPFFLKRIDIILNTIRSFGKLPLFLVISAIMRFVTRT